LTFLIYKTKLAFTKVNTHDRLTNARRPQHRPASTKRHEIGKCEENAMKTFDENFDTSINLACNNRSVNVKTP
jgi:hypothetical protein